MSIDLALVFPRLSLPSGDPPLGIASIAAYVRSKGYRVAVVDGTWMRNWKRVAEEVVRLNPDIVGIYTSTYMLPDASKIAGRIRLLDHLVGRRRTIVAGGPHITIRPWDCKFLQADHAIKGEGEYAVVNLLQGNTAPPPYGAYPDLTQLPPPALDLLQMENYVEHWHYLSSIKANWPGTNLLAARGCQWNCHFCQPTLKRLFGNKVRRRSAQQVADEMEELHARYGIAGFFFHDDTFTADRAWLAEFFTAVSKLSFVPLYGINARIDTVSEQLLHDLAISGCRAIHYGLESATQRILDHVLNKGTRVEQIYDAVHWARKYRISTGAFAMIGNPTETREEIQATIDLVCALPLDEVSISLTVPLPGTTLYSRMEQEGYKIEQDFAKYNYYKCQPFTGEVPLSELKRIQRDALFRFYRQRPGYIARHFTSLRGIRRLLDKIGRFK